MSDHYWQQEAVSAGTMAGRLEWEHASNRSRQPAVAADAELCRHLDERIEPLRSAQPAPISDTERDQLHLPPGEKIAEMAAWIGVLAAQRQAFREEIDERHGVKVPSLARTPIGMASARPSPWRASQRDAILQPPKPRSPHQPGSSRSPPNTTSP